MNIDDFASTRISAISRRFSSPFVDIGASVPARAGLGHGISKWMNRLVAGKLANRRGALQAVVGQTSGSDHRRRSP
jgi:hypothetical protein